jgi:hypothetical protein
MCHLRLVALRATIPAMDEPRWWTIRAAQNRKPATYEWLRTQPARPGLLRRLFGRAP